MYFVEDDEKESVSDKVKKLEEEMQELRKQMAEMILIYGVKDGTDK